VTPSVRVRLKREGLREAMKRQVQDRVSRKVAIVDHRSGEGGHTKFGEAGRPSIADPEILTKS
jgi:hypothetical protein